MGRGAFPAAVSQADVLQGEAHLLHLARTHCPDRALARGIGTGVQEGPSAARQMHPEVRETLGAGGPAREARATGREGLPGEALGTGAGSRARRIPRPPASTALGTGRGGRKGGREGGGLPSRSSAFCALQFSPSTALNHHSWASVGEHGFRTQHGQLRCFEPSGGLLCPQRAYRTGQDRE